MTWTPDDPRGLDGDEAAVVDLLLPPADGRTGPARRLDPAVLDDLYLTAVDEALEQRREDRLPAARAARPARRWRRGLALAAALLLAASVGSGAGAIALHLLDIDLGGAELAPAPEPADRSGPPRSPAPVAPRPPAAPQEVELPPAAVETQPPAPARSVRRERAPPAPRPGADPIAVVPEDVPPEDLLALANERRQRRAWRDADAFYAAVATRFPATDAAVVAEIASAALRLVHLGDAAGALAAYRRALAVRPSGPLAEDARWGIAEVHRTAGDLRAEAAALREFLARHPGSPLAPAARRRLDRIAP